MYAGNVISDDWLCCWPPVALLGILAAMLRSTQGSWLAPGAAWSVLWFCATAFPLVLAPEYPVNSVAIWVIFICCFFVAFGSLCGDRLGRRRFSRTGIPIRLLKPHIVNILMYASFASAIRIILILVEPHGLTSLDLLHSDKLHAVAEALSVDRYQNVDGPVEIRLHLSFIYFCCLLGGFTIATNTNKWRERFPQLIPLLGAFLILVVTSARAGFLLACVLWVAAYIPNAIKTASFWRTWKRIGRIRYGLIGAGVLIVIFIGAMFMRYGSETAADWPFLLDRIKLYFTAHISVFSSWWNFVQKYNYTVSWGQSTFFGPFALVGLSERKAGVYSTISDAAHGGVDSNIFTIYRGLIEDFTLLGALTLLAFFAFGAGYAYRCIRTGMGNPAATPWLTAFYIVLFWSPIINPFGYTTICVAFTVYVLLILLQQLLSAVQSKRMKSAGCCNNPALPHTFLETGASKIRSTGNLT